MNLCKLRESLILKIYLINAIYYPQHFSNNIPTLIYKEIRQRILHDLR